jgi:hypothetical protein
MMTALPLASDFTGSTRTEGQVKAALTDLRAFLATLLGTDGSAQTALAALGAFGALTVNISTATSLTAADRGRILRVTATANVTLPALSAVPVGWTAVIFCTTVGTATVLAAGADLIGGAASVTLRPGTWLVISAMADQWVTWGAGGAVDLAPGAAAAPPLFFTGDSDTGLFRPAADVLGFTAGGVERARVTAAGMQVTGLLTGTAVAQSASDTTAGRLLTVGAGAAQLDATLYRRGNIIGTVTESAGVPTGALFERGSNANGVYIRFGDGTQICTRRVQLDGVSINTAMGGLFRANVGSFTFPATFTVVDFVGATLMGSQNASIRNQVGFLKTRQGSSLNDVDWTGITLWSPTSITGVAGEITHLSLFATGRWF